MSEEKRKVWSVEPMVKATELDEELNLFAEDGYQIHSIHKNGDFFMVVAFDPMQIMRKQGEDMQAQMAALMNNMAPGGAPGPR